MNKEQLIQQRYNLLAIKASNAKSLHYEFPKVEYVTISATISFISATDVMIEKEYNIRLDKDNLLYVHFPCTNKDCTSLGFDITETVRDSIRCKEELTEEVRCDGKEDWKYYNNVGCSCDTTLHYIVTPHF